MSKIAKKGSTTKNDKILTRTRPKRNSNFLAKIMQQHPSPDDDEKKNNG